MLRLQKNKAWSKFVESKTIGQNGKKRHYIVG